MTRNSSDACWSSDDSSFGWVDMEDRDSATARKGSVVEETSGSDDDSSDDSDTIQFDSESKNRTVLNPERDQKQNFKEKDRISTKATRGQVQDVVSEDSDTTQFDAEFGNRPVREEKTRTIDNNPLAVKDDQFRAPGVVNVSHHEISHGSISGDTASESSDGSDKRDLKPFTKGLSVKKERISHALSDDSNVESPTLRKSLRIKAESGTTQPKTKEDKRAPLIEGVLLDTVQPLPFDIGANEDVWIVQCPYDMSESTLKGKAMNFNGISCAEQFEGGVLLTINRKPINLLLPKSPLKLTNLTPTGHIIYKEKEMAPHILHPVCNEDDITSLPTGLKVRHPLFGADVSLVQRLCSPLRKVKKKKKKQDVSDLGITFCKDENKVIETKNSAEFNNSFDASSMPKKKKKKKNKHLDEQTVTVRQDLGIENHNLQFHSDITPKIPNDKNRNDLAINDCIQTELQHKKHKKMKHEPGEMVSQEFKNVPPEFACVTPTKKRKHKHLEYSLEYDRQVAGGTSDEVENISSQKRKKLKYEDKSNTSYGSERTEQSSFAESSLPMSSKKKKHHNYEREFQSEYLDSENNKSEELAVCSEAMALDPITDGLLHTDKKKKKKFKENGSKFLGSSHVETNADFTSISTKKKKKVKMENSDEHLVKLMFDTRDPKNNVCDVSGADSDYFDVNIKKLHKKERKKFEERDHSPEFSEENPAHSKFLKHTFNHSFLKQESSYLNDSAVIDAHQKKKKKRKSE